MEIQPTLKPLNFVILVSCLLILSLAPPLSAYDVLYERERKVLSDLNNDKSERIKHFFKGIKKNATQLSKDVELLSAFEELRELHYYFKDNESNIKDVKASYNYNTQDKYVESIRKKHGYNDIFFIDLKKNIIYSAAKDIDFGQNLEGEVLSGTVLNTNFKQLLTDTQFTDFSIYLHNSPSTFITSPLKKRESTIGILVIDIPIHKINEIMHDWADRPRLGSTGDSFLIGEDGLLRSGSFMYPQFTVEKSFSASKFQVDQSIVQRALNKAGSRLTNDVFLKRNKVLQVFNKFNFLGTTWIIISDKDISEIESLKRLKH